MESRHYTNERTEREEIIKKIGVGVAVASFRIDRGHRNGPEIHTITSNAIIIIRNERTNKMITKLIARPKQIERYFDEKTETVIKLMKIAKLHQMEGYNEM